jgi:hypothetical protein
MRYAILLPLLVLATANPAVSGEWMTQRSFYTHDPVSGQPTHQFATPPPAVVPQSPSFQTSGYSHYRSTLQFGQSADNYHRVEQWGPPVRPYGEWRFPYRPYSVPYDQWGPPYGGLNIGLGFGAGYGVVPGNPGYPNYGDYPRVPGRSGAGDATGRDYPGDRFDRRNPNPTQPYPPYPSDPYPSGPGFGYPVPPYADGYYPDYPLRPRPTDREFYYKPRQGSYDRDNR